LRINSGGRAEMSLAVATTNMRARCSASHVRNVPNTRRVVPRCHRRHPRALSQSRRSTTHTARVLRLRRVIRADSFRTRHATCCKARRSPIATAARRRCPRRLAQPGFFPQPCTPSSNTPLGGSNSGALPSKAGLRLVSQVRRFCIPPTSANFAVSGSYVRVPPRFEQLVLGGEHALQVRHCQCAVVEDRLAHEALGIAGGEGPPGCQRVWSVLPVR